MAHQPVLLKEVLQYLTPSPGENFIDCTVGFGGHALSILEKNKPEGRVLGIELDGKVLEILRKKTTSQRLILTQGNFVNLKTIVEENNFYPVNGILFDLGMSSWQIEESGRGFSFMRDEPLDMRFEKLRSLAPKKLTAEEIVNNWSEQELINIFQEYGEEKYAGRIAQLICQVRQTRPIKTTGQLVEIIRQAVPVKYQHRRIHFATRVFQALRIAVNDELNNLRKALPQALEILVENGRLIVISFHSLEDRIVKNFFRQAAKKGHLKILTKKPIRPTVEEIKLNPRSRSAKLRVALK
jgi:16S rRNA (cytosine1402-N4)-methyltransferase